MRIIVEIDTDTPTNASALLRGAATMMETGMLVTMQADAAEGRISVRVEPSVAPS